MLVQNPGRVLDKDELLRAVWSDSFVEEASLATNVSALRKALGERPNEHGFIVTVPGRGYRFVAEVRFQERETMTATVDQQRGGSLVESHTTADVSVSTRVGVSAVPSKRVLVLTIGTVLALTVGSVIWWLNPVRNRPSPGLSIVVLPFLSVSGEPEIGHLSEALTENLRQVLAVEAGFVLESRAAEFQLKGMDVDLRTLAHELHVATALKGSVQQSGNQTRVTVHLVDLQDGHYLWSEGYELDEGRLLDSQATLVSVIVRTLRSRFGGLAAYQLSASPTKSDTALKWYLKGREEWLTQRNPAILKSVEDYQKASPKTPIMRTLTPDSPLRSSFWRALKGGRKG